VGIDLSLLEELCSRTLDRTDFAGLGERYQGKVRDNYSADGRRTIVVTDRVSCFDVVVGTLPLKGQVLNRLAAFWFEKTRNVVQNHLIEVPDPNVSLVRECELLPVEFVYRGYLTGSTDTAILTAYERGDRVYCGHHLPDGLKAHEMLPKPLLTPTTKAPAGHHDELTSRDGILAAGIMSEELFAEAERATSALFEAGTRWADKCGLILADTKYELGLDTEGHIVIVDEIHTPDSSRYWYKDRYEQAMSKGESPSALDKEYVRLWLGEQGYKGHGAPPELPNHVRCEAASRYIEAFEQVTQMRFEADLEEPIARIRRNLGL
jgi:phosphoribosylaminoimidazole-succinocarboxamide synthase